MGTQGCRQTFEKAGGGRFYSRVEKTEGGGDPPPTYGPGHMPGAQHLETLV